MTAPMSRVGTTYNIPPAPPDPASTDWLDAGPLRIGVEYRKVDPEALEKIYAETEHLAELKAASPEGGFADEGVSIHVVSVADDFEYLRFDMFLDEPHYHYVDKAADSNTIVNFDTIAHGPVVDWTLMQLRTRLPEMLRYVGANDAADSVDDAVAALVADQVVAHLRSIGEYE
ncbi:MAG: hypothetical protein ACI9C1_001167 [Candidatus Aldehydirespiratoraceae bacterium]|jgi:hypothetical protein